MDPADARRVLAIAAHPDDLDFGSAGAVAAWTDAGLDVSYCVVTDGKAGGFDRGVARADIPAIRRDEQRKAADLVGVTDVAFLGYVDGEVTVTLELRHDLSRVIREVRPDRVICPSPRRDLDRVGRSHPDHLAVGEAALDAVYPDARNPFAHESLLADEGLEPWVVREVWLAGDPDPDTYVDITGTYERKLAAILAHTSQHPDAAAIDPRMREGLGAAALAAGYGDGRLAESYRVIKIER
jgi:LmbE family N-acetylglucosaminyl deacetylase